MVIFMSPAWVAGATYRDHFCCRWCNTFYPQLLLNRRLDFNETCTETSSRYFHCAPPKLLLGFPITKHGFCQYESKQTHEDLHIFFLFAMIKIETFHLKF